MITLLLPILILLWPSAISDFSIDVYVPPNPPYSIMEIEFSKEVWEYHLCRDGSIRKVRRKLHSEEGAR